MDPILPVGFRSSIVDTVDFLARHREACLQCAMKGGEERGALIEAASRLSHATLLLKRAYPWAFADTPQEGAPHD